MVPRAQACDEELGFLVATIGLSSLAPAADLPTQKAWEPSPTRPDCFSSQWTYLSSSASDCRLTYAGVTLYGTLDGGYGYETHGVPLNPSADKPNYGIHKNSNNTHWLWSPNALSTSVIGVKMEGDLGYGVVEAGFNPYSGMLINGPQSKADNNVNALANQSSNFNSSRAGQWDNSQGFVGLSNPACGTLTWAGVRYSMWSNLDVAAGLYYRTQNDYLPSTSGACTGTGVNTSSNKCAGSGAPFRS